jgi:hypothetical protein
MFPHERALVKKLEGKPFVLIGVNSDRDPEKLKKDNEKEQITWRSFKNDRGGKGQISKDWAIEGWPTIYLIDHKGVIREMWLGSPGNEVMDNAIEKLVKEAESAGKNGKK